jgi:hypothetical protein
MKKIDTDRPSHGRRCRNLALFVCQPLPHPGRRVNSRCRDVSPIETGLTAKTSLSTTASFPLAAASWRIKSPSTSPADSTLGFGWGNRQVPNAAQSVPTGGQALKVEDANYSMGMAGAALSSPSPSTIAARFAGRTVSGVMAIRGTPGSRGPREEKTASVPTRF